MKKALPLLLSLFACALMIGCKSSDAPKKDPYEKIDEAYQDHMKENQEEYEKEPD